VDLRLGIDVGGTNTDAVVIDKRGRLVAKSKVPTSPDVTAGMTAAIDTVLAAMGAAAGQVTHVMLGTTHATNALLERRDLRRVAVLRIGAPAANAVLPLHGWPEDLRGAVSAGEAVVPGGIEFDGREVVPLDGGAVAAFLEPLAGSVDAVAIASVFGPVGPSHELEAARIARAALGQDAHVSLSHEIGSIGLLERENATVLNAALVSVVAQVATALQKALAVHDLSLPTFFAQNDGTLVALEYALRYPVLTIGSGPANSMRGAAWLSGAWDALVADVGGTSTDIGALVNDFPREASGGVEVSGVQTNFRMPDLMTIPLGGGSVIEGDGEGLRVGPRSVGYRLSRQALAFGGTTPTLTDAAVAAGRASIGSRRPPRAQRPLLEAALARADLQLAEAIDRVKASRADKTLIVVGGGSVLVPERLPGVRTVIRPTDFEVANAIGAAIAQVGGQVDRVFQLGRRDRRAVVDEACGMAYERAVEAGADPAAVKVVELEEIPLSYLRDPAIRIRVKTAGPLGSL
jgi:N-methylhydantoinase A/oxoprolinase/acetone carboxylase beta subunit